MIQNAGAGKWGPLLFGAAVLLIEPFAEHALQRLAPDRQVAPVTCIGPANSGVRVVYLHGLDSFGPSWQEIENRRKLRALSELLGVRFAVPRAPGRWWRARSDDGSAELIRSAARQCFDGRATAILGFSDGANLTNDLYATCRGNLTTQFLSAGSSAGMLSRSAPSLDGCGHLTLYAGRHEPGFTTTRLFAQQLARRGASVDFVEHPGVHELPFEQLFSTLRQIRMRNER